MIYQNDTNENIKNKFSDAAKQLQLGKLLRKSNIRKSCGVPAFEVFQSLLLLAAKVISAFDLLTRPERVKVLVPDDSVIKRNHSKAVELLARIYDHVGHKYQEAPEKIDRRSNGYKAFKESMLRKPEATLLLIERASPAGCCGQAFL